MRRKKRLKLHEVSSNVSENVSKNIFESNIICKKAENEEKGYTLCCLEAVKKWI